MKKIIPVLAAVALALGLAGCGTDSPSAKPAAPVTVTASPTPAKPATPKPAPAETDEGTDSRAGMDGDEKYYLRVLKSVNPKLLEDYYASDMVDLGHDMCSTYAGVSTETGLLRMSKRIAKGTDFTTRDVMTMALSASNMCPLRLHGLIAMAQ